jgi:hypothetical protein
MQSKRRSSAWLTQQCQDIDDATGDFILQDHHSKLPNGSRTDRRVHQPTKRSSLKNATPMQINLPLRQIFGNSIETCPTPRTRARYTKTVDALIGQ